MGRKQKVGNCAYCGEYRQLTDDHVPSRALYPESKTNSRVQRITVPACEGCNGSWKDDEVQFRNIVLISGESNAAADDLWKGKTLRSFDHVDGTRRVRELAEQMVPVRIGGAERHMVYPARDERVCRVLRKVIRGLCHHHQSFTAVPDNLVWVDVQRYEIPPEFFDEMKSGHVEPDIFSYRYAVLDDPDIHSFWLLRFFERTPFIGMVFRSALSRARVEHPADVDRERLGT